MLVAVFPSISEFKKGVCTNSPTPNIQQSSYHTIPMLVFGSKVRKLFSTFLPLQLSFLVFLSCLRNLSIERAGHFLHPTLTAQILTNHTFILTSISRGACFALLNSHGILILSFSRKLIPSYQSVWSCGRPTLANTSSLGKISIKFYQDK